MKYVKVNLHNSGKYLGIQGPAKGVTVPEEIYNLMKFLGLHVEIVKETARETKNQETDIKPASEVKEESIIDSTYTEKAEPEVDYSNIALSTENVSEESFTTENNFDIADLSVSFDLEEPKETAEEEYIEYTEQQLLAMKRVELRTLINKKRGHERITDPYHATKDEAKMSIIKKILQEQEDRKLK